MRTFHAISCAVVLSATAFAQQAAPTAQHPASSTPQPSSSAAAAPTIPPPANPITAAQIKEMQDLTGANALQKRIIASAMQYYRSSFPPYIPQDVVEDMGKSLENADLGSQAAAIYPKYISTEDAAKIIEFYKSPAGQRLMAAQPSMMTEMQRSSVQTAQQVAKDVIARHKTEIDAAQQKYMQEHEQQGNQPKPSLNTPSTPQKP